MNEYALPELKKQVTSLLPVTQKKSALIKSVTTPATPKTNSADLEQKTISVFLTPAKNVPSSAKRAKETLEQRRQKLLQRIREKKNAQGQVGEVDNALSAAYERGEWCISGLFLYPPFPPPTSFYNYALEL